MKQDAHTHIFEIVPLDADFHRDDGTIRKPLSYSPLYLRACTKCTYAEKFTATQIISRSKKRFEED